MSPIEDKQAFARTHIQTFFPNASTEQSEHIVHLFETQFYPNYSPLPEEQESPTAAGSGVNGAMFVAFLGGCITHEEPVNIDPVEYGQAIRNITSI